MPSNKSALSLLKHIEPESDAEGTDQDDDGSAQFEEAREEAQESEEIEEEGVNQEVWNKENEEKDQDYDDEEDYNDEDSQEKEKEQEEQDKRQHQLGGRDVADNLVRTHDPNGTSIQQQHRQPVAQRLPYPYQEQHQQPPNQNRSPLDDDTHFYGVNEAKTNQPRSEYQNLNGSQAQDIAHPNSMSTPEQTASVLPSKPGNSQLAAKNKDSNAYTQQQPSNSDGIGHTK